MSNISTSKVYLEPIEHVYIHRETGVKYQSVTKTISSIEPHFDSEAVSLAIANQSNETKQQVYIGMNQAQILEYWQMLNDEANTYGTLVHNTIEEYLKANKWWFPTDLFQQKVIAGYDALNVDEGIRLHSERIMFSEKYELAGTSDLVIDIDDIWFDIGDYKTNKKINFYNPYGHQTLLKPFDHLQNCQYSIYSLQLSIYAYMYELEQPTRRCRQIFLMYWDKNVESFVRIPVTYLKKEAKQLLELHKYNSQYK